MDEEEVPDTIIRLWELVAAMPEQWQNVGVDFMWKISKVEPSLPTFISRADVKNGIADGEIIGDYQQAA